MDELIRHLAESMLFRDLTLDRIRNVLNIAKKVTFRKNDIIMEEGMMGDTMYIILEGEVEVIKRLTMKGIEDDHDKKSKVFTKLGSEQNHIFGEVALLGDSERTATIRALSDCVFYEIRKGDFMNLAESDYELGYRVVLNLARIVGSRLRKVNEDTMKLATVLSLVLKEN